MGEAAPQELASFEPLGWTNARLNSAEFFCARRSQRTRLAIQANPWWFSEAAEQERTKPEYAIRIDCHDANIWIELKVASHRSRVLIEEVASLAIAEEHRSDRRDVRRAIGVDCGHRTVD